MATATPSAKARLSDFSVKTCYDLYACSAIADAAKAQVFNLQDSMVGNSFEPSLTKISYVLQALIEKIEAVASDVDAVMLPFYGEAL